MGAWAHGDAKVDEREELAEIILHGRAGDEDARLGAKPIELLERLCARGVGGWGGV